MSRGTLTIFGASTGEGKSILKLHLATHAAKSGKRVLVIDMEDPLDRTADRTLSNLTDVNNAKMGVPDVTEQESARIRLAADDADWADNIDVHPGLCTANEVREAIGETEADLVLLDYLQGLPDGDGLERTIAELCWDLNKWAQDNKAACVAFSQVTRSVEERGLRYQESHARRTPDGPKYIEGFRPFGPADLAWCSAAGQRCKELGFLFRPGRYRRRFGENVRDDTMEINFPKRNWGQEGTIKVGFDGRTARLHDLARETT